MLSTALVRTWNAKRGPLRIVNRLSEMRNRSKQSRKEYEAKPMVIGIISSFLLEFSFTKKIAERIWPRQLKIKAEMIKLLT